MPFLFFFLLFLSSQPTFSLTQDGFDLLQAKASLSDPAGSLSSWNSDDPTPCNWTGVSCDPVTHRVTSVDLSDSQLAGPFPLSLCRLPYLSYLSLLNNLINSSLTADISACQTLTYLILAQNFLVGTIPGSLARIPNLRHLDLTGNNFTGEIPVSFGEFMRLESLILSGNLLNGTIPSFLGNISTLKELLLPYNPFTPSQLPSQLGNLSNIENLWISTCNLVGPIPASLGRLTRLQNLDLSSNRLTGWIPASLTELKSIVQIELYENFLSGQLPLGMWNLTSLRRIDLSANELTGLIPDELCGLELGSLSLYENRLEGSLPESISRSQKLYELVLFNNKLSGQLPGGLGKNSPLERVDVSYNGFSGQIPESLCEKGVLNELVLIFNSFSGNIPANLGKCRSLNRVRLRNNELSGMVPSEFWGLPHVYLLDLVENSLSGNISSMISGAHNLSILLISKNKFSGFLPSEIGMLDNLAEFSGSNNEFMSNIPTSLVNLSKLSTLDLSDNQLYGEIPFGIQGWKKLNELNLANNGLSGKIPSEIGSLRVLNYLDLSGNFFSGKIPLELQNLKLNLLNLSNNRLLGDLPPMYAKKIYRDSFLGNPGLCGDLEGLCAPHSEKKSNGYLWILLSIFILAGFVFVAGVVWFYLKYKNFKENDKGIGISKWKSFHKYGFSELEITDCLKENNVIGSGASGKVYKVVLSNGEVVAVKKLWAGSKKEDSSVDSERCAFEAEVETLGNIRHKNIVRLWCCCNNGNSKLLVYEYMPNGSLGDLLHGSKGGLLDWPTRFKIALDAAEGLSYLHHGCIPPIVHRDVKSNNILLDKDFGARVADFGVAKFVGVDQGVESMSVIAGSCGYIAPEYAYTLRVNEKSDIYSFGVVILELVTGRLPVDPEFGENDLVKWVCNALDQKAVEHVIDSKLDLNPHYQEVIREVLDIGLLCTSSLPINRPSMRRVVKMLQEAGARNKSKSTKDGKLLPYYHEEFYCPGSAA